MNAYDVAVIGGGAAGLSAALVLARARRRVVVVDSGHPRNAPAAHMHGFLGSDGLPPATLLARGRSEVAGYGGEFVQGTITAIAPAPATALAPTPGFALILEDDSRLLARRVLVTTGLSDEIPHILGLHERWGRDLLHCPYCHGYEVCDQPLGVIGSTPEAVAHTHLVRQWSDDVLLFTHGAALSGDQRLALAARGIGVVEERIARLVIQHDQLTGVELKSGQVISRRAMFVRPHLVPHDTLLTDLGCTTRQDGWVTTDPTGRTSVRGIWAAGNAVNPRAQVITAAGEGSAAAIDINTDLVEEDISAAVTQARLAQPLGTS